jgi:hypothetical protein
MQTTVHLCSPVTGHDPVLTQHGSSCENCGPCNAPYVLFYRELR